MHLFDGYEQLGIESPVSGNYNSLQVDVVRGRAYLQQLIQMMPIGACADFAKKGEKGGVVSILSRMKQHPLGIRERRY